MESNRYPYSIWFTADLHLRHKNILQHQPARVEAMGLVDADDIDGHDRWIVDMWYDAVKRNDHVYVLGDLILADRVTSLYLLGRLKRKGVKIHLIIGNHDKSTYNLTNMFESIDYIKVVDFKASVFDFLPCDLTVAMCHYPMKSWPRKPQGSINLYGHVHANAPWIDDSDDLCLNVGLDSPFANFRLVSLRQISDWYSAKLNGLTPREYIEQTSINNPKFIR